MIAQVISQLRFTDLEAAIDFYAHKLGGELSFRYEDFYAGVQMGKHLIHLKLVDVPEPNIEWVQQAGHFHVMLEVDNLSTYRDSLLNRNVSVSEIVPQPYGDECFTFDSGGHTVYFVQSTVTDI